MSKKGLLIPDINFKGGGGSAAKLIKGGASWSWDLGTKELSFVTDAFVQVPGLQDGRNTIPVSESAIILTNAVDVAYVTLNADEGLDANLTVSVDDINNETNVNSDVYIIARRVGDDVVVGNNLIKDGQTRQLDSGMTWADPVDTNVLPDGDKTRDLGSLDNSFKTVYSEELNSTSGFIPYLDAGEITTSGNIDLSNNLIINMSDGTVEHHGVNLGQLDAEVSTLNTALDTKATRELNNLRNTAVNDDIIPDTNNARDLGTDALEYKDVYTHSVKHGDVSNPDLVISTTSASGNISVETHESGVIVLKDQSVGHIGHVWTESGVAGQGNWDLASDTFQVWEDIKDDFTNSPYNYLAGNVFAIDKEEKTDISSTTTYQGPSGSVEFVEIGDFLLTEDLFTDQFISDDVSCPEAYIKLIYENDYVDSNPTVEITRDGTNYEAVVLDRIGSTGTFYGKHIFTGIDTNPLELRLKITGTEINKYLKGIGIFHNRIPIGTASAKTIEYFFVDSDQQEVTLSLANILAPDKDLLKVEIPETGQVFRTDSSTFSIEGRDLVFSTDFFYDPPLRQIKVIVNQAEGSVFDSSDANGSLLQDNHLGSANSNVDLSKAGRGIILQSPDGTLYEITVQDGGAGITIFEVV